MSKEEWDEGDYSSTLNKEELLGEKNVMIGYRADCKGSFNIVIGTDSYAEGNKNVVFGYRSKVKGNNNIIFGDDINIEGDNQVIFGNLENPPKLDYQDLSGIRDDIYYRMAHLFIEMAKMS